MVGSSSPEVSRTPALEPGRDGVARLRSAEAAPGQAGGEAPRSRWARLGGHLSFRLFLVLFGLLALLQALHAGLLVRQQTRQLTDTLLQSADRIGNVIQRSTRAAMMRNQRTELHEMIENVGSEPGFDGVRVFNKQGHIMFSTDKAEIGRIVDLQAEACYRCHAPGVKPPHTLQSGDRARVFKAADGHRVLGLVSPIPNATDCSAAACHAHSPEQTVLGVLDVRMSLAPVDARIASTVRQLRDASLALVLAVALAFAFAIHRLVQVPVDKLIEGTRAVSAGHLDHRIDVDSGDELGTLASSFNRMTDDLRRAEAENRSWALTLEDKVRRKSEELQHAQAHLMQMDKMASLGKLAATVAHEINNPLAGILTYARLVERDLVAVECDAETRAHMQRYLGTIGSETRRCGDIVQNLLSFARTSGIEMVPAKLEALVETSLALVRHHFDLHSVRVERQSGAGDAEVVCAPGEIEQALLALLVNAAEAMPSGGRVGITTELGPETARIAVANEGAGIPPDVLPHIFEPFYTTKSATKGVGLGLAVVFGIMQRHGGRVEVRSQPDQGSTFSLVWPRRASSTAAAADAATGTGAPAGGET